MKTFEGSGIVRNPKEYGRRTDERRETERRAEDRRRDERKNTDSLYRYDAVCSRCGKATKVSFLPDGQRPVYCKDCLNLLRDEKNREAAARKLAKQEELKKIDEAATMNRSDGPDETGFISLSSFTDQQKAKPEPPETPTPKPSTGTGELKSGEEIIFE